MRNSKLLKRISAIVVMLSVLAASITTYIHRDVIFVPRSTRQIIADEKDRNTAEDISVLSGVSANKLMDLRNEGKSWNEIMELVKDKKIEPASEMQELDKRLQNENFLEEDIAQAKMLVERIMFSLNEITRDTANPVELLITDSTTDLDEYKELSEKIDKDEAIYYTLKIYQFIGSFESALDEYLYSIQIDADISLYITDRDEYEKQMSEKGIVKSREQAITVMKIENKMLEMLNNFTKQKTETALIPETTNEINQYQPIPELTAANTKSDDIMPQIENPMPPDPTSAVMNEINDIVNRSLN